MSEAGQTMGRMKPFRGSVNPKLPLEMWYLISKSLLTKKGIAWIKGIHHLLLTCRLFNKIIFNLSMEYIRYRCNIPKKTPIVPNEIPDYHMMPIGLNTIKELRDRLSMGYYGKWKQYRIKFNFQNEDRVRMITIHKDDIVEFMTEGEASLRVILFFAPSLVSDLMNYIHRKKEGIMIRMKKHEKKLSRLQQKASVFNALHV